MTFKLKPSDSKPSGSKQPLPFKPMRRDMKRGYALNDAVAKSSLNVLIEGFRRGNYILPRSVRRFLRRPLEAYQGRPRLAKAITTLATLIGRFHTGEHNFVQRGCGIGGEGAGFFLSRKGLCGPNGFAGLTEALVREATQVLIQIGFIERITPPGELTEVRAPKNAKTPFGYFRRGHKAEEGRSRPDSQSHGDVPPRPGHPPTLRQDLATE